MPDYTTPATFTGGVVRVGSVSAIAERLKVATILTTDRRHFSIIRSKDGSQHTLLP
jgi:uncharacterized protein YerC